MGLEFRRRIERCVVTGCCLLASGCFPAGEAGPTVLVLEADAPVVSDLSLASGERVRFTRSDGNAPGGWRVPAAHVQGFEPVGDATLQDLLAEAADAITTAGWELNPKEDTDALCAVRDRASGGEMTVHVGIERNMIGEQGELANPFVFVRLENLDRCL